MRTVIPTGHFPGIDSLRALAVLSVVFFHLDRRLLPGGFTGVDVFFVISGFVVSLSMSRVECRSLADFAARFYARRFMRIVPALVVCLLATTLLACLFVPVAWLSEPQSRTGLAAFAGLSNLVLASPTNGYFSPRAEFNPFTHTWSLAVEEQFYLVFPLVAYFFMTGNEGSKRRRFAGRALLVLCIASLATCAWLTRVRPSFAFYLMPPRFWEMGVGVGLFMTSGRWLPMLEAMSRRAIRLVVGSALAILFIGFAVASDAAFPFPWALGPVLTTALLLAVVVSRPEPSLPFPLATRPVRWIGKVSYSLYLWHWPAFVLLRWTLGMDTVAVRAAAILISLGLAAASFRWVETPVRLSSALRRTQPLRVAFLGIAAVLVGASAAAFAFRNESAISLSVTSDSTEWLPDSGIGPLHGSPATCGMSVAWQSMLGGGLQSMKPDHCAAAAGKLLVAGDSHAGAYFALLRMFSERSGHPVVIARRAGCGMIDLIQPMSAEDEACRRFAAEAFAALLEMSAPGDVLFLPSLRLPRFRDQWGGVATDRTPRSNAATATAVAEARALLASFSGRGVTVVFEAPKPLFRSPTFRCSDWFNRMNSICEDGFLLSRVEFDALRRPVLAAMAEVTAQLPRARIWDPATVLCEPAHCSAYAGTRPVFFDGDHLSGYGNALLFDSFDDAMTSSFARHPP